MSANTLIPLIVLAALGLFFVFKANSNASSSNHTDFTGLTGRLVLPEHNEYEKSRLVSNYYTSKEKYPKAIIYTQNTQDVQNAVKWARKNNVPVRLRSGGHNHEGFSTGTDVLVIDVSEMKKLELDKEKAIAKAETGVNNHQLYSELFKQGFTHSGGTCSDVSVSGLASTGGMGPLLRKEGLAIDTVLSFDIVDANGNVLHATKDNEHKDLFWAVRGGGGGNFGVLTNVELKVFPATDVTWFNIGWDWSQPVDKIIATWQDYFLKADRRWFSHLDIWSKAFPKDKFQKMPVKFLGVFWGTPEEAKKELAPLLAIGKPDIMIETVTWAKAMQLIEDSTAVFVTDKPEYKSPGAFIPRKLDAKAIDIVTKTLGNSSYPLFNVLIFSLGGAAGDVPPTATAYYYRDAKFFINYAIQWLENGEDVEQKAAMDKLYEELSPYTVGDYVGNPDANFKDYLTMYYGENVDRLRCVKRKYDPDNFFKFEQSIPPSAGECL